MPAKKAPQSTEPAETPTKGAQRTRAQAGRKRTPKKAGRSAAARKPPPKKRAPAKRATKKKPPPEPITPDGPVWERAFLATLSNTGNVRAACTAAKVGRSTVYDRRQSSEAFDAAWAEAIEQAADMMEAEALRRAVHGVQEPVYYKGKIVGHVLKYSDVMLIFLLKAARPEKFRERFEHTGKDGGPIEFDALSVLGARLGQIAAAEREARTDRGAEGPPPGGAEPG